LGRWLVLTDILSGATALAGGMAIYFSLSPGVESQLETGQPAQGLIAACRGEF
jgi:hypothetical protein